MSDIFRIRDLRISEPIAPPPPPNRDRSPSNPNRFTLRDFVTSITLATIDAKRLVDEHAVKLRRDFYSKDELLKSFPLSTIEIEDVEVELKFLAKEIDKESNDIIIDIDPEKLKSIQNVSSVKFRLVYKPLVEYKVDETSILK